MSKHFFARAVIVGLLGLVGMSLGCDKSPAGPAPPTAPSSATVSSVAVNGSTDFTSIGQTVQLTATATFSDGATQNVSAAAPRWTSQIPPLIDTSNPAISDGRPRPDC